MKERTHTMKKRYLIPLLASAVLAMASCSIKNADQSDSATSYDSSSVDLGGSDYDYNESISVEEPEDIEVEETDDEFQFITEDGEYSKEGNVYSIKKAGTYSCSGSLSGQILIEAGE